jgi:hypothetical protein
MMNARLFFARILILRSARTLLRISLLPGALSLAL